MADLTLPPFYDTTAEEVSNSYVRILARPGKNIQNREFNTLQGLIHEHIKSVGNMIAKDGTIIEGCVLTTLVQEGPFSYSVKISNGKVYVDGRPWEIDGTEDGEWLYTSPDSVTSLDDLPDLFIDVVLTDVIITEDDDPHLRSPALNSSNYNNPGAHRLKTTASFVLRVDPEEAGAGATQILALKKGVPVKLPSTGAFSEIEPILARQTYDMHGNFLVSGMNVRLEGEDLSAWENEAQIKPATPNTTYTGYINGGTDQHPYGLTWTNRIISTSGDVFDASDVLRSIIVQGTGGFTDYDGSYTIRSVISPTEIEVYGQFEDAGSLKNITWAIKKTPQNWKFMVDAGKAYVQGHEISKPVSSTLSVNKAIDTRSIVNEVLSFPRNAPRALLRYSPYAGLTQGGEGVTGSIFYGIGMDADESGYGEVTYNLSRGVTATDDLHSMLPPTSNTVISIIAAASADSTWEWHLDPTDVQYPGEFVGGHIYEQSETAGWIQNGNGITWAGNAAAFEKPAFGDSYKVMISCNFVFDPDVDFRIKQTSRAILYPTPSKLNAVTNALYFPQEEFDLANDTKLEFVLEGKTVKVDFAATKWQAAPYNFPADLSTTKVPLVSIVNAINAEASLLGEHEGYATAVLENDPAGPVRGWVVLQAFRPTFITITVGNNALGFAKSAWTAPTSGHYLELGATRMGSLIPYSANVRTLQIDYDQYLMRKDLVVLDGEGTLSVMRGDPDEGGRAQVSSGALSVLSLASLEVRPDGSAPRVVNYNILRTTMPQIRRLENRIQKLEYDIAALDLDKEAVGSELPTDLSGVLTDGFIGLSKADTAFSENGVFFEVTMDLVNKEIVLPTTEVRTEIVDRVGVTYPDVRGIDEDNTNLYSDTRMMTLPVSGNRVVEINQPKATYSQGIYYPGSKSATATTLSLDPDFNNYPDTTKSVTLQGVEVPATFIQSLIQTRVLTGATEEEVSNFNVNAGTASNARDDAGAATQGSTLSTASEILDGSSYYLPGSTVYVEGNGYQPDTEKIRIRFDGEDVDLSYDDISQVGANTPGYSGDYAGCVQAREDGSFVAKFTVPSVLARQVHHITAHVLDSGDVLYGLTAGAATYRNWSGQKQEHAAGAYPSLQGGSIPHSAQEVSASYAPAPSSGKWLSIAGQTFKVTQHCVIDQMTVYFTKVQGAGPIRYPLTVQIRKVESGGSYPKLGSTVYASTLLWDSGGIVPAPTPSGTGAVATPLVFDHMFIAEPNVLYAVVFSTWGADWALAAAQIGQATFGGGETVGAQPYQVGDYFYLKPGSVATGTPTDEIVFQPNIDLKFQVKRINFASAGTLVYDAVTPASQFTRFIANIESALLPGTNIVWEFSTDGGSTYYPMKIFDLTNANPSAPGLKTSIIIRATLSTSNSRYSPLVMKLPATLITRNDKDGNYITKSTSFSTANSYSEVAQTIKIRKESGSDQFQVYFGHADRLGYTTWVPATAEGTPVTLANGFTKYSYRTRVVLDPPDVTLPATLETLEPPVLSPSFDTDTDLAFSIVYWNGSSIDDVLVSIGGGDWSNAVSTPEQVAADINQAIEDLAISELPNTMASVNSKGQVIITHPQSYGPQRCQLNIVTENEKLGLTFSSSSSNGTILATKAAGEGIATGAFSGGTYAYYLFIAGNGFGSDQATVYDVDLVRSDEVVDDGDAVVLSFENRGKSLDESTTELYIYRALSASTYLTEDMALLNWKRISESGPLLGLQMEENGFVPDNEFIDTGIVGTDPLGHPKGIALHEDQAYKIFKNFRGRVELIRGANGYTPHAKDFTNVFVRTDTLLP